MNKGRNRGFTLIELIVVIAILAVLGLLLVPQITGYIAASRKSVGGANAKSCYSSMLIQSASGEAKLGITVIVDDQCRILPTGASYTNMTGASWTDKKNNKVYSFDSLSGEVTVADKINKP